MLPDRPAEPDAEQRLRQACAELCQRLRAGEDSVAEDLFRRCPDLAADADAALELLYTEFVVREELGTPLAPAAWHDRFPHWGERLDRLWQVHGLLARSRSGDTGSTSATLAPEGGGPFVIATRPGRGPDEGGQPGGYEVFEELGRGGMGVVYKARQVGLNRLVALKMILAGEFASVEEQARFRREAEAAARLDHPNIVRVYEVGEADGRPYLALEYVPGGNLADRLADGPLPAGAAARLVETLARAAHAAHEHGIVHRDLKPANILLASGGCEPPGTGSPGGSHPPLAGLVPKIADFGLAKLQYTGDDTAPAGPTRTGVLIGTASYMAPEQAAGPGAAVGPAADTYALGAILYECLTGRPPFRGVSPLDTLEQVRTLAPVPPRRLQPGVPRDLETICLKCLEKAPRQRYATAAALADDLRRFLDGQPIQARPAGLSERALKWVRRQPVVACLLATLTAVVVLGFTAETLSWLRTADVLASERDARRHAEASLAAKTVALARYEWSVNRLDRARAHLRECPPAHREAHWQYLWRACTAEVARLGPLPGNVIALAYHPNGQRLTASHAPGGITLWDVTTGRVVRTMRSFVGLWENLGFNGDGTRLVHAISSSDFTLKLREGKIRSSTTLAVWDPERGTRVTTRATARASSCIRFSKAGPHRVALHAGGAVAVEDVITGDRVRAIPTRATSFDLSPDGTHLALCEPSGIVAVWDLAQEAPVARFGGDPGKAYLVALSGDGEHLARATIPPHGVRQASRITVWDYRTGIVRAAFPTHEDDVTALAFSPVGSWLATASRDRTVILWDTATGRETLTLRGHTDDVTCLCFSPDGCRLASGSRDRTVRVWDIAGLGPQFAANPPSE
jgi:serine/threonine protein kinase